MPEQTLLEVQVLAQEPGSMRGLSGYEPEAPEDQVPDSAWELGVPDLAWACPVEEGFMDQERAEVDQGDSTDPSLIAIR